jgi:hypothetical protein
MLTAVFELFLWKGTYNTVFVTNAVSKTPIKPYFFLFIWRWKIRFFISKLFSELRVLSVKTHYPNIHVHPHRSHFMMVSSRTDLRELLAYIYPYNYFLLFTTLQLIFLILAVLYSVSYTLFWISFPNWHFCLVSPTQPLVWLFSQQFSYPSYFRLLLWPILGIRLFKFNFVIYNKIKLQIIAE